MPEVGRGSAGGKSWSRWPGRGEEEHPRRREWTTKEEKPGGGWTNGVVCAARNWRLRRRSQPPPAKERPLDQEQEDKRGQEATEPWQTSGEGYARGQRPRGLRGGLRQLEDLGTQKNGLELIPYWAKQRGFSCSPILCLASDLGANLSFLSLCDTDLPLPGGGEDPLRREAHRGRNLERPCCLHYSVRAQS